MKIRRAECLLSVAIVTAAVVAPIRVHTMQPWQKDTTAQAGPNNATHLQSCDDTQSDMLRAACATRGERRSVDGADRSVNRADAPRSVKLWV
jgi:hypothetical protein